MGQFKNQGDAALTLAEECAEVVQVIAKLKRFGGTWHEVPPGKDKSRIQMLKEEMDDVLYQWNRLQEEIANQDYTEEDYWMDKGGDEIDY